MFYPIRILIVFAQSIRLAMEQIWANKVRSILTAIGIIIGVASVTAVVAALTGLRQSVLQEFENLGTTKIFIFPRANAEMRRTGNWGRMRFEDELFDGLLDRAPALGTFTRLNGNTLPVSYDGITINTDVTGIDPTWHDVEKRGVSAGRPFGFVDAEQGTTLALVNQDAVEQFRLPSDPTGEMLQIDAGRFMIVGVVEDGLETNFLPTPGGGDGPEVYIPFRAMQRINDNVYYVIALAKSPAEVVEASAQVQYVLRPRRGIDFGEEDDFGIEYVQRYLEQFDRLAIGVTAIAGGIVAISLVVGGVGIMNIMLVSVSERTREIGLRKALGARPAAILTQFLVEAVVLCLLGGAVGVLFGQVLTSLIRITASAIGVDAMDDAYIPLWAVSLAFGFSATTGLVFGLFPAWKASRLDPIVALRHE